MRDRADVVHNILGGLRAREHPERRNTWTNARAIAQSTCCRNTVPFGRQSNRRLIGHSTIAGSHETATAQKNGHPVCGGTAAWQGNPHEEMGR